MSSSRKSSHAAETKPWYFVVDPVLYITLVWCIFSFKIFLISFGEAGLRPDDLLILASFLTLVLVGGVRRTPISAPLKLYFVYVGVELMSAVWNGFKGRVDMLYSLIFVTRLMEYVVFYFIGYALARSKSNLSRITLWYAYTLFMLVPLQMAGLIPIPGIFDRARASGNTNGPYELAIVSAFLLCFVAYRKRSLFLGAGSLILVILTASRITLVATVLSVLHFAMKRTRSPGRLSALVVGVVLLGGGLYSLSVTDVIHIGAFDRLKNSSSLGIDDARAVYELAPTAENSKEYIEGSFENLNGLDIENFDGDTSGLIRFTRWLTLLKTNLAHTDSIIIGLGPSFGSAAVDGYYTRCFVETGVLGVGAFLAFLGSMVFARRGSNWSFREYLLIMTVSAVFIDVFLSYKSMLLLWLWHGINQYGRESDAKLQLSKAAPLFPTGLPMVPSTETEGTA